MENDCQLENRASIRKQSNKNRQTPNLSHFKRKNIEISLISEEIAKKKKEWETGSARATTEK